MASAAPSAGGAAVDGDGAADDGDGAADDGASAAGAGDADVGAAAKAMRALAPITAVNAIAIAIAKTNRTFIGCLTLTNQQSSPLRETTIGLAPFAAFFQRNFAVTHRTNPIAHP